MIGNDRSTRLVESALNAASQRHQVIANNIANVNTPGFKRSRVEFESELAKALAAGESPESIATKIVQDTETTLRPDGNNVDIEVEQVLMAENQLWYAALTRQISDHFARLRLVIHDGRR